VLAVTPRQVLGEAGGRRTTYRLVSKVLQLFDEASWRDQERLLTCLRAGDRRQTGAMRLREFKASMSSIGLHLNEDEYLELFNIFDQDGSGDITFDELVMFLDRQSKEYKHEHSSELRQSEGRRSGRSDDRESRRPDERRSKDQSGRRSDGRESRMPDERRSKDQSGQRRDAYDMRDYDRRERNEQDKINARYAQEQERRALLKGHPGETFRAFRKLRKRLHEMNPSIDKRRLMNAIDIDRNGEIDRHEFANGLRYFGINMLDSDIRDLFKALDQDGNGNVDAREICLLLELE